MKKHLLIFLLFLFPVFQSAGQQLLLLDSQNRDISNDTLIISGSPQDELLKATLFLHNGASQQTQVWIRIIDEDLLPGAEISFCRNTRCYTHQELTLAQPLETLAGKKLSREDLYGNYYPGGQTGTSTVTYEFFSDNGAFDPVRVVVRYAAEGHAPGISQRLFSISSPSPNPAAIYTHFSYSIPLEINQAFLIVRDLTGTVVLEEPVDVNDTRARLNVSDLSNGIFLYSLVLDGQPVVTRKLIVSR
ncbi:MAG: T9SS type A sorting domain-containing protein [Bacteroidales bacterium]